VRLAKEFGCLAKMEVFPSPQSYPPPIKYNKQLQYFSAGTLREKEERVSSLWEKRRTGIFSAGKKKNGYLLCGKKEERVSSEVRHSFNICILHLKGSLYFMKLIIPAR